MAATHYLRMPCSDLSHYLIGYGVYVFVLGMSCTTKVLIIHAAHGHLLVGRAVGGNGVGGLVLGLRSVEVRGG